MIAKMIYAFLKIIIKNERSLFNDNIFTYGKEIYTASAKAFPVFPSAVSKFKRRLSNKASSLADTGKQTNNNDKTNK